MSRFVSRDGLNRIAGVYARLQPGIAEEELADDNPEVIGFLGNGIVLTPAETDAQKNALVDSLQTSAMKALYLMLFDAANESRALKGQAPLTSAQFKTYAKGKLT